MKNLVLIVAAGSGSRFGGDIPKQYQLLNGKPILAHTIEAFTSHPQIDGGLVVISDEHQQLYNSMGKLLDKVLPFALGGKERQDSVRLGFVEAQKYNPQNVLIHDAARPYIDSSTITRILDALETHQAVIPVISVSDSVRVGGEAVNRDEVKIIQTPQGFHFKAIMQAHDKVKGQGLKLTDDAQVFESVGGQVFMVEGDIMNKKITNPLDLRPLTSNPKVGFGYDVHEFESGDSVIICGVKIPHNKKLKGHSDADVGLHAITDAILGAIGAGDIGEYFPPSDAKWKNADSAQFLQHAASLVKGTINNIDVTIICEEPKITPHKKAMRKRVAEILGLSESQVNIKATTTEGLGFTGRREGIASQAVASISVLK